MNVQVERSNLMKKLYTALTLGNRGYTLIELLVVLIIIGIVTSAVVVKVVGPANQIEASQSTSSAEISAEASDDASSEDTAQEQTIPEGLLPQVEDMADRMEFQIIQTALDTMMIRLKLTSIKETQSTTDMSSFPGENPLYPRYLRNQTTKCRYSCDSTGQITQSK
jgi:prepilin-type N-terminal cleavage/methylation domain-containing protein